MKTTTLCIFCLIPSLAAAEFVDAELGAYSSAVWRGFSLADAPSLQPSVTMGSGPFSLNVWGALALSDREQFGPADILDLTATYAPQFGKISPKIGYMQYIMPGAPEGYAHSEEIFVGVGFAVPMAPTLTAFYDFGLSNSAYVSLALAHVVPLSENLSLNPGLSVAVSDFAGLGFNDATGSLDLNRQFGAVRVSLRSAYSYTAETVNPTQKSWFVGLATGIFWSR